MNTEVCERCGLPVPRLLYDRENGGRFVVCRVTLCRTCYEQFIETFQNFLNEGG